MIFSFSLYCIGFLKPVCYYTVLRHARDQTMILFSEHQHYPNFDCLKSHRLHQRYYVSCSFSKQTKMICNKFPKEQRTPPKRAQKDDNRILDHKSRYQSLGYKISLSDFRKLQFFLLIGHIYKKLNKIDLSIFILFLLNWPYTRMNVF